MLNSQVDWDGFDSEAYFTHNYWTLRGDDAAIIAIVRDFFATAGIPPAAHAIDVGSGTNLYPAMAMLPFCVRLDLVELSTPNVAWLNGVVPAYGAEWDQYWKVFAEKDAYAWVVDPRAELARKVTVSQGSVFALPEAGWDVGTMFFVACSLSTEEAEFRGAVTCFLRALRPGSPFAVAFMARSQGCEVGGRWYPAVSVDVEQVEEALAPIAYDGEVSRIPISDPPLRDGYGGMIVATGRVAGRR